MFADADWRTTLRREARFVLRAGALMGGLFLLTYYPYGPNTRGAFVIDSVLELQGRAAAALLSWVDPEVQYVGGSILGRFPLRVVKACGAFDAHALLAGAVLAYPALLRDRLLGVMAGAGVLLGVNTLRMAALYLVGVHVPHRFDMVHEELFPLLLVLTALVSFAVFTLRVGARASTPVPRAAP